MNTAKDWGLNFDKPFVRVSHSGLYRVGGSAYQSLCPECKKGHLMMVRAPHTLALTRGDRCTYCGQGFIYTDETVAGERLQQLPADFEAKAAKMGAKLANELTSRKLN